MKTRVFILPIVLTAVVSCATQRKVEKLKNSPSAPILALTREQSTPEIGIPGRTSDSLVVISPDGRETIIMKAIRDDDGEMVANDVLDAAMVTARFRNVAERHGKIDLEFQIRVPQSLQDSKWQLRFFPKMFYLSDSLSLDPVLVTGKGYRKAQLRGYEQYRRFLGTIVRDTTRFIDLHQLEVFLERNLPEVFALKSDTTFVSDEAFASLYGVTQRQAVEHYTNWIRVRRNRRRYAISDRKYRKYVKAPIVSEGLRLDTVITAGNGDFIYNYVQTVLTRPKLRKIDVTLDGDIFEQDRRIYRIPRGAPLTFYISSLNYFVDSRERYVTKVIERKVSQFDSYRIDFEQGRSEIIAGLSDNGAEIARIRRRLSQLLENEVFELDSIIVGASSSPEGSLETNTRLTQRRSETVSEYFQDYIRHYRDSLIRSDGYFYNLDRSYSGARTSVDGIRFIPKGRPENWEGLDSLVKRDSLMSNEDYDSYCTLSALENQDRREAEMRKQPYYAHLLKDVYPRLRTVRFDFHMHRKDMVKDTVHTTVLDTAYMAGVNALMEHDYRKALEVLRPYGDYNAALALTLNDYNSAAKHILLGEPRSARVDYLLSVLYSREGDEQNAVTRYLAACAADPSLVHRGNLDPEISSLIKKYGLNEDLYEDEI
jgi:hypothetical protein